MLILIIKKRGIRTFFLLLCFLFLILANLCRAQVTVKGTVQDSLGRPIPTVSVYATGLDSVSIKAGTYTDGNGHFSLQLSLHQSYLLHVRSLGYRQEILNIPSYSAPHTIDTTIVLHRKAVKMKTLIVQTNRRNTAIITKKDTIIYHVQAFENGSESTVEDILKELPGVTVTSNGRIKVNGKPVTKVLIGGEDLFGRNYQLLTKNLTAKAIKSVSVYKHYHNNSVLQGVSHSNQTVLNLGLKKSFKVDFFGSLTGYYDLDDHYKAKANVISITKNFKGYLFENANNVGSDPAGSVYMLMHSSINRLFSGEPTLGMGASVPSLIGTSPQHIPHLRQSQYLNNQTSFHAIGMIYKPVKKLKLKGVGYFLPANRQVNQRFVTAYDPSLGVQNLVEQHHRHINIRAWLGQLTAAYTFFQNMNLKYIGKFKAFPQTNRTRQTFRNHPPRVHLNNHDYLWIQNLKFTRSTQKGQAYQIRLRYKNESKQQYLE